jgi:hypothetical protein
MARPTLVRRVLPDGGLTRAGAEVLVARHDGQVEIRDVDAGGPVIKRARIEAKRVAVLAAVLARPEWAALTPTRGSPVADGPSYEITGNHRRVTRFDRTDDEPVVRRTVALLKAIWNDVDP